MKNILKFIKPYTLETVLGPLFKLFEALLELFVPLVIADIIDTGIANSDTPYIIRSCLFLALLGAVGLAFSVTAQFFSAKAAVGAMTDMKSALFRHIGSLSYTEIDRLGSSTMIGRLTSDADKVQNGINLALRLLLRSPFVVFGAMIMAFTVNGELAVTFAVVIPVLAVAVFSIMLVSIPLYKAVQSRLDGVLKKTRENLSGARVVRAFCKEDEEIADFGEKNDALTRVQKFVGSVSALMNPLTLVIINVGIIALIYSGALKIDAGELSRGELVALYNYMSQILVELIKFANLIITITRALASSARIGDVFATESSMAEGALTEGADSEYALEFSDVSLTYSGAGAPSLSGVSFSLKRGEVLGVIGGTGSGKSSLINLIPRFYDASSGTVSVFGEDVRSYKTEALREQMGIVPQKATLFSGTVRDNMRWGNADASDEDIYRALEIAQAKDVVLDKGGLDFEIEEGGKNLSGGQKQRLTIARALVRRPKILILDDSASALDYATDKALRRAIADISDETTVVIVSQRSSSVMGADKIIVLEDGEVDAIGTHDELLSTSSVYREIYESQFGGEAQ